MNFKDDEIGDFIAFKANNPNALYQQIRLIQDRNECVKKLDSYSQEMQNLKTQLLKYSKLLDILIQKRKNIENNFIQNSKQLEQAILDVDVQIEEIKRQIQKRKNEQSIYNKRLKQTQKDIYQKQTVMAKKHFIQIKQLKQQKSTISEQNNNLKQIKMILQDEIKKLKDRQIIFNQRQQKLQLVRQKWKSVKNQLDQQQNLFQTKTNQINDMIRYHKSMQKVVYQNIYKRSFQFKQELTTKINKINQKNENNKNNKNITLQKQLNILLERLKLNQSQLKNFIKEKRSKYLLNQQKQQSQCLKIIKQKIDTKNLAHIQLDIYNHNFQPYASIDQITFQVHKHIVSQRLLIQSHQKQWNKRLEQIQNLKAKINNYQQQISSKKSIESPLKRKK